MFWYNIFFPRAIIDSDQNQIEPSYKTICQRGLMIRQIKTSNMKLKKTFISSKYMNTVYRNVEID